MKGDYPELSDITEFTDLSDREMRLVWYFANVTSPLHDIKSSRNRMSAAIEHAFGNSIKQELRNELLTGQYPEKFRSAFERMGKFEIGIRSKANTAIRTIFENFIEIVNYSKEEMKEFEDEEKDNYVNNATKVYKALPELVRQMENGYGIRDRTVEDTGGNIMDMLITEG